MAEVLTLPVEARSELGKRVRKLRRADVIPAVVYGRDVGSKALAVKRGDFLRIFRQAGENTLIRLVDERGEARNALIHDVSRHPRDGSIVHVDFYQVRMDEAVRVGVPLEFVGSSPAVANEGGILVKALQELEVETLPGTIPDAIQVDISKLSTFDDAIYVKDLNVPQGVRVIVDPSTPVASVQPPRSEEELKALEEKVEAPAVEEVVVETEEKRKEREAEKAAQAIEGEAGTIPAESRP